MLLSSAPLASGLYLYIWPLSLASAGWRLCLSRTIGEVLVRVRIQYTLTLKTVRLGSDVVRTWGFIILYIYNMHIHIIKLALA